MRRFLLAIAQLSFLLFVCSNLSAQESIEIYGKLKLEKGSLDGKIELFAGGSRESIRKVTGSGKFEFNLDYGKEYVIAFSQEGYVTKKISFNTTVPSERQEFGFAPFEFQVTLFKQYEGVNFVVFNQPVAIIKFDEDVDELGYDTDYTKSMQQRLAEVQKEVEKKSKEEDKLAKTKAKTKPEPPPKPPVIKTETQVKREDPPTTPKRRTHVPPPPPPKRKLENLVVLHSYTIGEIGYPNLSSYGYINFGDGTGRREITKEQFDEYAKLYH